MDNRPNMNCKVKPIYYYLKESFKFYDIDSPLVAQTIFVLQLAAVFGGYLFSMPYTQSFMRNFEQLNTKLQEQLSSGVFSVSFINSELYARTMESFLTLMLIVLAIKAVTFVIGLFYASYYYLGLTRPAMKGPQRALLFFARLPKLVLFNILFYIAFYFAVMVLILTLGVATLIMPFFTVMILALPFVIFGLNALFIFKDLLIVEFNIGILRNFKKSFALTQNNRKNIIVNSLWPLCTGWLLSIFAMDLQNAMLSIFIASFMEVIILLVSQRLNTLMFIDAASIERHDKKVTQ